MYPRPPLGRAAQFGFGRKNFHLRFRFFARTCAGGHLLGLRAALTRYARRFPLSADGRFQRRFAGATSVYFDQLLSGQLFGFVGSDVLWPAVRDSFRGWSE